MRSGTSWQNEGAPEARVAIGNVTQQKRSQRVRPLVLLHIIFICVFLVSRMTFLILFVFAFATESTFLRRRPLRIFHAKMGHIESPSSNSPPLEFEQQIYDKFNNVATKTNNRDKKQQKHREKLSKVISSRFYGRQRQQKYSDEFIEIMNSGLTATSSRIGNRQHQNCSAKEAENERQNLFSSGVAVFFRNLGQICSAFWQRLITFMTSSFVNVKNCWHIPSSSNNLCFSLLAIFLFLLLQICLSAFSLAHFLRLSKSSNSLPSAYFLLALLFVLLIASTLSALLAIFRPSQNGAALHLRPLLFLTFIFSFLGLPLLLLPLPYCFHLASAFRLQCSNRPFLIVALSLLLSSLLILRPFLQYWLAKLRLVACLHHLRGHPLEVATHFNTFLARMEATTIQNKQQWELATLVTQWKEGFGQQLQRTLKEAQSIQLVAKCGQLEMGQLEIDLTLDEEEEKWKDEEKNGRKRRIRRRKNGRRKSILMKRKEGTKINNERSSLLANNDDEGRRRVQFSQLLLLREISSVQNEIGQLVRMDQHQKFVLESLYADFVRDFRLKMDSSGHLRANSAHQIFTRFGPVETMHYTKMTSKEGGKESGEQIYRNLVEGKDGEAENGQKIVATIIKSKNPIEGGGIKGAMKGKRKGGDRKDKDYATIDSAGEATNDLMRRAVVKCLAGGQSTSTTRSQLQPQVPSTPIPQTTPTDPQGPIMDGMRRGVQPLLITLYENFAARMVQQQQKNHRMEEVKEEDASKEMDEEMEVKVKEKVTEMVNCGVHLEMGEERDEEEEQTINRSNLHEKVVVPMPKKRKGKCNCSLGEDCMMVTNSRAKSQYYYLKPGKNGRTFEVLDERIKIERNETDKDDDGDEEQEEEEDKSFYFTR